MNELIIPAKKNLSIYLVSSLAFLYWFDPVAPFIVHFLISHRSVSLSEVTSLVLPLWGYMYLIGLTFVLIFTRRVGYRNTIFLLSTTLLASLLVLLFSNGLVWMCIHESLCGFGFACNDPFMAAVFQSSQRDDYHRMTSWMRAAGLAGTLCSALIAQMIVYYGTSDAFYVIVGIAIVFRVLWMLSIFMIPEPHSMENTSQKSIILDSLFSIISSVKSAFSTSPSALYYFPLLVLSLFVHRWVLVYWQSLIEDTTSSPQVVTGYATAVAFSLACVAATIPACISRVLSSARHSNSVESINGFHSQSSGYGTVIPSCILTQVSGAVLTVFLIMMSISP